MHPIETSIYTAVLITGIVLGTLMIYFALAISRNQRKHFKMLRNHVLAEMQRLEEERTRIARDLHDELGPLLSVTQIHINAVTDIGEKNGLHLDTANSNIRVLMQRFGEIARNLTPRVLVTKGLHIALNDFFEQYREVTDIKLGYHYNVETNIPAATSLHIYRIVLELVHNAVKHSGAASVDVLLHEKKKNYISCAGTMAGV